MEIKAFLLSYFENAKNPLKIIKNATVSKSQKFSSPAAGYIWGRLRRQTTLNPESAPDPIKSGISGKSVTADTLPLNPPALGYTTRTQATEACVLNVHRPWLDS